MRSYKMIIETVKIKEHSYLVNDNISVPNEPANRHYQAILDWINEGNTPEGPDVIEPDYVALRTGPDGYASTGDQLGMIADGTQAAHVAEVKARFPKSNTGSITVGDVPQDILDAAADKLFAQQLTAYTTAQARLAEYQVSVGREEVTSTRVIGQEPVLDEDGMATFDDNDVQIMQDITEDYISVTAIEAVDATVEQITYDDEGVATAATVENPLITKDNAERTAAQAIVDATPQPVIDEYNS